MAAYTTVRAGKWSDTPSSTGTVTLTLSSGTTTVTTGKVYFDGLPDGRFTQFCRHYGYTFDVTNIQRTTDSFITTATEATVAAYTGIAINHSTSTLTITVAHTLKEIYDYCKYNLCLSANHAYADFFTTGDGVNFTCNYNLSIDGVAVTGTASTLTVLTGKTAGVINSGSLVSARIISVTSGDTGSTCVTATEFCTVMAATTGHRCTPKAAAARASALSPAPPPLSLPAMLQISGFASESIAAGAGAAWATLSFQSKTGCR